MKHAWIVAALVIAGSGEAFAQGTNIHNRYGTSGSHFNLPSSTGTFEYSATVSGIPTSYEVQIEVYHNGILKFTDSDIVQASTNPYLYGCSVGMATWGLSNGDTVTFILRIIDTATGATLDTHCLYGDVNGT